MYPTQSKETRFIFRAMVVYKVRLLLIGSLLYSTEVLSQQRKVDINNRINLSNNLIRLDSLIKKVSKQTGFIFSYNTRKVNHSMTITLNSKNQSVAEILVKIKEKTGLDYTLADNHIILKQAKPIQPPVVSPALGSTLTNHQKSKASKTGLSSDTLQKAIVKEKKADSVVVQSQLKKTNQFQKKETESLVTPVIPSKDSVKSVSSAIEEKKSPLGTALKDSVQKRSNTNPSLKTDSVTKRNIAQPVKPAPKVRKHLPILLMAGLTADETTYLGSMVQLGIPALYGTVSYKTNFNIGLISYGLGTSFKVGDIKVNVFGNTGSLSKAYQLTTRPTYDTSTSVLDSSQVTYRIKVKSNLTRIGIMLEKSITPKIIAQFGLTYNSLTTKYTVNDSSSAVGFAGINADKNYCTIAPVYFLNNSYSPASDSNVKNWIGIQVNILYFISFRKRK